ncbi:hypothetical protein GCM10018779_02000 [Streptomyces griseocarneus]|nr:hypothetical protein GCM10018779_02000 [Streptomyces griseocarneus]
MRAWGENPGLGRWGVAKAVEELIELGYYVRRTVRDEGDWPALEVAAARSGSARP